MMGSAFEVTTDSHFHIAWNSSEGANVTLLNNSSLPVRHHVKNALLGMFLGSLSLLTVVMNILVLYAIKKEKKLHTVGNLYIVSLSVADLIVGSTVMPLNLVYLLETEWRLGLIACQFWLIMDYVASTASIFSLFILCLDRYRSVRQPLRYLKYRTSGRACAMIGGAWLLSITWVVPILGWRSFSHIELKPEMDNKCDTDFRFVTWFKVVTAVFNFYVPSILMLCFYTRIYLAVRQHFREREKIMNPVSVDSFETGMSKHNVQTLGNSNYFKIHEKEEMALSTYDCLLDYRPTLVQMYYAGVTNDHQNTDTQYDRNADSHQSMLITAAKRKKGDSLLPDEVHTGSAIPLKVSSLPFGFQHSEDMWENNVEKYASVNDCDVVVPNSLAGVCEITQESDVHRYTTVLYNNNEFSQTLASQWPKEEVDTEMDAANSLTLKQAWQRFCEQSREHIHKLQIRKEHKAAKQLGCIIAVFMMCWIPYFIAFMVMAFCQKCVHHDLHMFTIWLGYMNSMLNPFIYPLCNENFKRVFKAILHVQSVKVSYEL